jgi:hypothetical protein
VVLLLSEAASLPSLAFPAPILLPSSFASIAAVRNLRMTSDYGCVQHVQWALCQPLTLIRSGASLCRTRVHARMHA